MYQLYNPPQVQVYTTYRLNNPITTSTSIMYQLYNPPQVQVYTTYQLNNPITTSTSTYHVPVK